MGSGRSVARGNRRFVVVVIVVVVVAPAIFRLRAPKLPLVVWFVDVHADHDLSVVRVVFIVGSVWTDCRPGTCCCRGGEL